MVSVQFDAPDSALTGTARFTQQSVTGSVAAPSGTAAATVFTSLPNVDKLRNANSQVRAAAR